MKSLLYTLYSLILFGTFSFSQAQEKYLIFRYDDAGNQILRSPSTDGISEEILPAGTATSRELLFYPNPVDTELNLSWVSPSPGQIIKIEMVSYNGTLVETLSFTRDENKITLDMSHRFPGVYYLKIYCSNGKIYHHSFIKK